MFLESLKINEKLRPIRLAFLISCREPGSVLDAVKHSTCLWGGMFNPIVPIWKKFPTKKEKDRVIGLLKDFDPDFIVNLSTLTIPNEINHIYKKRIIHRNNFVEKINNEWLFYKIGLSIISILRYSIHPDIKRFKDSSKVIISNIQKGCKVEKYWSFIFGNFPDENYYNEYKDSLNANEINCSFDVIRDIDLFEVIYPILFTAFNLIIGKDSDGFSSNIIYLGNSLNLRDLVEFWNIRASGKNIIFVPINNYELFEKNIIKMIRTNEHFSNSIRNNIDLQKGPSISNDEFNQISNYVNRLTKNPISTQNWLPDWGREINHVVKDINPCSLEDTSSKEVSIFDGFKLTPIKLLSPSFFSIIGTQLYKDFSWAIEIQLGDITDSDFFFTAPNDKLLERYIQRNMYMDFSKMSRISNNGVVLFSSHIKGDVQIFPQKVFDLFKELFKENGFSIKLSSPGNYAKQIINSMGGLNGCRVFKIRGVREVLHQLSNLSKDVKKNENINKISRFGLTYGEIKSIIGSRNKDKFGGPNWDSKSYKDLIIYRGQQKSLNPEITLDYLINKNILRTGLRLTCRNCTKEEWYDISEFSDKFKCKYCFEEQNIGVLDKKEWFHKANGLFMIPDSGMGSLAMILTLWRLKHASHLEYFKYISSFNINNSENSIKGEVDFACIIVKPFENTYDLIIGEAKNYTDFSNSDFKKLTSISRKFSHKPYLCFCTLKDEFSSIERKEIKKLIRKNYKIIAMTRLELDPYDLYNRFKNAPFKTPVSLNQFNENTIKLNIE